MKISLAAALAVAALSTQVAAPASAQTQTAYTNNPVTVTRFASYPVLSPLGMTTFSDFGFTSHSSEVRISFVNTANVPAKSVQFAVRSGNKTVEIVDKGTFAPGARIVHTFSESPRFENASSVRIEAVTFADGSTWNG